MFLYSNLGHEEETLMTHLPERGNAWRVSNLGKWLQCSPILSSLQRGHGLCPTSTLFWAKSTQSTFSCYVS